MKLLFSFLLFISITASVYGQRDPVIENGESYKKDSVESVIDRLQTDNDYVLSYRKTYPNVVYPYYILTRKNDVLSAYSYSAGAEKLNKLDLSEDLLNLWWKAYTEFDIFKIRDERFNSVFCPDKYRLPESHTYEIALLSKGVMKKLSYSDPEYYHRVCGGMFARKNVIDCVSLITYVLNKYAEDAAK